MELTRSEILDLLSDMCALSRAVPLVPPSVP